MEMVATARAGGAAEAQPAGGRPEARRSVRVRMLVAAQVAFRGAALGCVLVDASPEVAQVFLKAPADVPDLAELRLPGGGSRLVRRRWQSGLLVGFEVVGATPLVVPAP